MLTVCYDLAKCPPTYDFVGFLLWAEHERRVRGDEDLAIHVLPGPAFGFRDDKLPPSLEERRRMLSEIVLPMTWLLPSCRSVTNHPERPPAREVELGRDRRQYGTRLMLSMLAKGIAPLVAPEPKRRAEPYRRYVTITLREAPYWPTRNANLAEWLAVAAWLAGNGVTPVFVRDTAKAGEAMPYEQSEAAARFLVERANLYAGAALNLFVNNGPAWMCMAMGLPLLMTKMIAPDAPCANAEFFAACGLKPGSQIPGARSSQRILWEDDSADAIIPALEAMLERAA